MDTQRRIYLAEIHGDIEDLRDRVEEMRNQEEQDLKALGEDFRKSLDGTRTAKSIRSLTDLYQSLDDAVGAASTCY